MPCAECASKNTKRNEPSPRTSDKYLGSYSSYLTNRPTWPPPSSLPTESMCPAAVGRAPGPPSVTLPLPIACIEPDSPQSSLERSTCPINQKAVPDSAHSMRGSACACASGNTAHKRCVGCVGPFAAAAAAARRTIYASARREAARGHGQSQSRRGCAEPRWNRGDARREEANSETAQSQW